jgi:hypothetical protein
VFGADELEFGYLMPVLETPPPNEQISTYEGSVGPISGKWGVPPGVGSRNVYRMHGARRVETVRRGANHPQYRHGGETLEAKAERHEMAVFFHETENLMAKLGMLAPGSTRTRGRKPVT